MRTEPGHAPLDPATCEQAWLTRDGQGVTNLAARIGVGERHLRRLFDQELGASSLDVAATRRLLFAKQLLGETSLPVTAVAAAAGYASLRRFNAAFVAAYAKPPREFRRGQASTRGGNAIELRLPYRAPYDFKGLLAFHARRGIAGVEAIDEHGYRRLRPLVKRWPCFHRPHRFFRCADTDGDGDAPLRVARYRYVDGAVHCHACALAPGCVSSRRSRLAQDRRCRHADQRARHGINRRSLASLAGVCGDAALAQRWVSADGER